MASKAEQIVSHSLRTILGTVPLRGMLPDSEHLYDVLGGLNYLIPGLLDPSAPPRCACTRASPHRRSTQDSSLMFGGEVHRESFGSHLV
jgi:hypothetical protein